MKNTVYALAREFPVDPPEEFGIRLARTLRGGMSGRQLRWSLPITVHPWERAGPTALLRGSVERRLAIVTLTGDRIAVEGGLEGLGMLRTSGSAFSGFLHDRYTTLTDAPDRLMATDVSARWKYAGAPEDWQAAWRDLRAALITAFSTHQSQSVQQALYSMGTAALAACEAVAEIRLVLPNRHHLLVDLSPFGLDNQTRYMWHSGTYGRIERRSP
jgi:urate oxidase